MISAIHEQSADIRQGVVEGEGLNKEQGAVDMFGYAQMKLIILCLLL